jgi:UDP-glucose:glycoprotein glucosyltransferase
LLAPYAEDISQITYKDQEGGRVKGSSQNAANITVTVWFVAKESTAAGVADARGALDSILMNGFARRCGARVAVLKPESKLGKLILSQVRFENEDVALYVINGAVIRSGMIRSSSDLQAFVAREALSFGTSAARAAATSTDGDVVLYSRLALREVDSACGAKVPSSKSGRSTSRLPSFAKMKETLQGPKLNNSSLLLSSNSTGASLPTLMADLDVLFIIDPLGQYALEASTFVQVMLDSIGRHRVDFTLLLRPQPDMQSSGYKVPRVFSRFVLSAIPCFEATYGVELSPGASFSRLPQAMLLTVALIPPRPWFVAPFSTNYDLDNIILRNLGPDVRTLYGEYAIESLLVEGSCIDELHRPPQGLRLQMTGMNHTEIDTIVMANLGYFQLKTPRPGRWRLHLAPGRSRDIYSIQRVETLSIFGGQAAADRSTFSSDRTGQIFVLVDSLLGARDTLLRVRRKPGMENVPLLDPANTSPKGKDQRSVSVRVSRLVKRIYRQGVPDKSAEGSVEASSPPGSDEINVFSVASGHLYERFLKIMMLSATKHASVPIKFWLLENYLSPSFKRVIPSFAAEHGFKVEMVTYRWPAWLREQTEKQRIIWAYKILFLDVLFPLNLSRVIFVDSDQVVRGDLVELMQMDLQGAPYGYVPFCDSRKEVDGFRFWKSGFWKDILKGAPYHISALYVVDLDTFRETSAGDSLRYMYQSLSSDANSLSNLDQDLPNYAAVASLAGNLVPIFHLPQEWLWCESWCDDASKEKAKTIDLCNNPMTKEPKLTSARRIISEWVDLDDEATKTTRRLHEHLSGTANSTVRRSNTDQEDAAGDTITRTDEHVSAESEAQDEL